MTHRRSTIGPWWCPSAGVVRPILLMLAILLAACDGAVGPQSLDAGDPPHPPLVEIDGLSFGMTADEVGAIWGPTEDDFATYQDRAGYSSASLIYNWAPAELVAAGAPAAADSDSIRVLTGVTFFGGPSHPKAAAREELVARFGEPLSDAVLAKEKSCQPPDCEIWRAAECVVAIAHWRAAAPELDYPERLGQLSYQLQPGMMIRELPRARWHEIRGEVPTSQPPGMRETVSEFSSFEGATVRDIVEAIGPPNLVIEDEGGTQRLFYLFLDGTMWTVTIAEGRHQSHQGSYISDAD